MGLRFGNWIRKRLGVFGDDSADGEEFDFENEGGVWRNRARITVTTVGKVRWNGQLYLIACLHLRDALVPTSDDLSRAQHEAEGFIAIDGTVELASIGKPSGVMDSYS